jgi:hypothetical protein
MRLTLQPNDQPAYGQVARSHFVSLPGNEKAVLDQLNNGSWRLMIHGGHGATADRGLFGSPHDILALLEAEYFPTLESSRRERIMNPT